MSRPSETGRWLRDQRISLPRTAALGVDLMLWLVVALAQQNLAIFAIHVALLMIALTIVSPFGVAIRNLFWLALLPRSLFTVFGWYFAFNEERQYFIGTNADSGRFWDGATLPYSEVSQAFEDPFFPRINILLNGIATTLSGPSYLATTQSITFASTLMVIFATLLIHDLYGQRIGRLAGWLMAVSPIAIVFSTGLMRDSLIGMFGFLFLLSLNRALVRRSLGVRTFAVILVTASGLALAFLRSISLAGFVIAGFIMLMSSTPYQLSGLSRNAKLAIVGVLTSILTFAVLDRFDRFENMLDYAITVRAGEYLLEGGDLAADGITTRIAEVSPALFVLISPYALMQPLPFYAWDAPAFLGGPPAFMDVVISFGGLFNQLLFGFYILAIGHWFRTRDSFGVRIGFAFTLLLGALTLAGLGQIRMIMAHVHPFFFAGVALGLVQVLKSDRRLITTAFAIWLCCLAALYLGYVGYREWGNSAFAALMFLVAGFALWRLWQFGLPAPARRRRARRPLPGGPTPGVS